MRQKTFKITTMDINFEPKEGQEVILISRENVMRGTGENFSIVNLTDAPNGIGGNMDHTVKRFHGWRGTTDDIALHTHGVRKITKVSSIVLDTDFGYKITVGPDLHPDWE